MATWAGFADSGNTRGRASVMPIHTAVHGRARFKVAGLYRSRTMKASLENTLDRIEGIKSVNANLLTGNLLITFDDCYDVRRLTAIVRRAMNSHVRTNHDRAALAKKVAPATAKMRLGGASPGNLFEGDLRASSEVEPEHLAWHTMDADAVIARTGSSSKAGLSSMAASERLKAYGPNILSESAPRSRLAMLFDQLSSTPILLLIGAAQTRR